MPYGAVKKNIEGNIAYSGLVDNWSMKTNTYERGRGRGSKRVRERERERIVNVVYQMLFLLIKASSLPGMTVFDRRFAGDQTSFANCHVKYFCLLVLCNNTAVYMRIQNML